MMMWLTDLNQHNFLDPTDDGIKQADFVTGAAKKAKVRQEGWIDIRDIWSSIGFQEAVRAASAEWENEEEVKNVMEEESEEKVVKKEEGDGNVYLLHRIK